MNNTNEEEIQVTRTASCPSLSGRSTITYEVGSKGDSQYIRLSGNSAGGIYCKDWVPMAEIHQLLAGCTNIASTTLKPLYAGRSSNSPGFLLAALVHEKKCPTGKPTTAIPEIPPKKKSSKKDTAKIQ